MDEEFLARLSRAYAEHPLSAATILDRIRRQRGSLEGLTAMELAVDEETSVTDQNHAGGVAAVVAIASAVGLRGDERVLDVGTGLGGTPRVLAHLYGCRCHGVELTASRCRDAVELTRLVGLEERVTFTCGDFLTAELPEGPFDLVIGQGAFMHFPDLGPLLRRCAALMKPGAWLAVEEGYLRRLPAGAAEAAKLEALLDCWNGRFHTLADWRRWLAETGLAEQHFEDLSELAAGEFRAQLRRVEEERLTSAGESELLGWRLGAELTEAGLLGTMRLLARRAATHFHERGS